MKRRTGEMERERVKEIEQEDILDALPVDVCGLPLVHYLGARSVAARDFQRCDVVLTFFLGKRLCVAINILCRSKFPLKNVLISVNLNCGSFLKKMLIILNHNHCSHILTKMLRTKMKYNLHHRCACSVIQSCSNLRPHGL